MESNPDAESNAVVACVAAIEPLNEAQRKRVMEYLRSRYEFRAIDRLLTMLDETVAENKKLKAEKDANGK